jgi:hypothetical protein
MEGRAMPSETNRTPSNTSAFGEHHQGDPDIPEETYGSGHDSFNEPEVPSKTQSRAVPVPDTPSRGQAATLPRLAAVTDAKFLVDEFGVNEQKAASLIAASHVEPEAAILTGLREADGQVDPLAGIPTPEEPRNDLVPDSDEERLKPVLHMKNKRTGGG